MTSLGAIVLCGGKGIRLLSMVRVSGGDCGFDLRIDVQCTDVLSADFADMAPDGLQTATYWMA